MESINLIEQAGNGRWDEARAWSWYNSRPWLVGCNFIPSGAINQLEMWQADTFNPAEIDRELGWLAGIGMNSARVYLHDLPWKTDSRGFLARINQFLEIAEKHGIGIMFVFFDSCWYPYPESGKQREPETRKHNSFWVQSPGAPIVNDAKAFSALEDYVTGFVNHFRDDPRVIIWDVWNEPENFSMGGHEQNMTPERKEQLVTPLLAQTYQWIRSVNPTQPLTSAIWIGDWADDKLSLLQKIQLSSSDIISFHRYVPLEETQATVEPLKRFGRPLICTEYMARTAGSTFESILPYFHREKIGAYNWGAVSGKTNTIYPWDSSTRVYTEEPVPWFHDIFRPDGSPYDPKETALIKKLTAR